MRSLLQRMLLLASLLLVTYSFQAQTMTFDTGATEPGFALSGFGHDPGLNVLFPTDPNVNGQMVISKNSGCWNITSFNPYCWSGNCSPPGGGTWRAFSNNGDEVFFTIPTSQQPIVLNWENIETFTVKLTDPGTGNSNNTFNFDDVVYTLSDQVAPETPAVTFNSNNLCPGGQVLLNFAGALNDGAWQISRIDAGVSNVIWTGSQSFLWLIVNETADYTIQGIVDGGCSDPTPLVDFTIEIFDASTPYSGFTVDPGALIECPNQEVTVTCTGGVDGTGANTRWYSGPNGTGSIIGAGNPFTFTVSSNLTYHVRREGTCNNTASIPVTIDYLPNTEPPLIFCPPNVSINSTVGPCDAIAIDLGQATTDDICSYTITNDAQPLYPIGVWDVTWTVVGNGGESTCIQTVSYACCIAGCDDPASCSYDPDVTCNDGTCEYLFCPGCTYPAASNYNSIASVDDGSCLFLGCTDASFSNYNPYANVEDGSCENFTGSSCEGDLNVDGFVSGADLVIFLSQFGSTCL